MNVDAIKGNKNGERVTTDSWRKYGFEDIVIGRRFRV